ncbi:hypothetical protein [Streptomyces dangxiongensis]|uniref:hypothetical protein n=1 Tax=Streptomyces dangxiongensis TaxID=1442032 RepID=UPI0013CEC329|nr:hypothetical protein [Streptomyces dangxiongensis]
MNRAVRRLVTVSAVLFALLGAGAATASADEEVSPTAVVHAVTGTTLPVDPNESMVWD